MKSEVIKGNNVCGLWGSQKDEEPDAEKHLLRVGGGRPEEFFRRMGLFFGLAKRSTV
jgi:hypothetical protein